MVSFPIRCHRLDVGIVISMPTRQYEGSHLVPNESCNWKFLIDCSLMTYDGLDKWNSPVTACIRVFGLCASS